MENKDITSKEKIIIGCVAVIAFIAIIAVVMIVNNNKSGNDLQKLLDLGNKYIAEMDYEQAIVAFRNAIDIDPKCEEAYKALVDIYVELEDYDSALEILQMAVENVDNTEYFSERIIEVNELVNQQQLVVNEQNKENEQKDKLESSEEKSSEVNSETSENEQDKLLDVQDGGIDENVDLIGVNAQLEITESSNAVQQNTEDLNVATENASEITSSENGVVNESIENDNSGNTGGKEKSLEDIYESIRPIEECDYFINSPSELPYIVSPWSQCWDARVTVYANEKREFEYVVLVYNGDVDFDYRGTFYFMTYGTFQEWLEGHKAWTLENDKDYNPCFIGNLVKSREVYVFKKKEDRNGKMYNYYEYDGGSSTGYNNGDGYLW